MRKILIVVPSLTTGGAEKFALSLASCCDSLKYDITLLSLFPKMGTILEKKADELTVNVIYLNKKPGFDLKTVFSVYEVINNIKPDVVHAHLHVVPYLLLGTIFCRTQHKYYTVHNIAERDARGIHRLILKCAFHFCGYQPVAISNFCLKSVSRLYGIPQTRIPCIDIGIDTSVFQKNSVSKKTTNLRFINVGRFVLQKNHQLLLSSFAKMLKFFPNAELELVGDGELRDIIENQCKKLGIVDKVIMNGISADVAKKLNDADIYVSASDYEGLPQTILEAMSCGLPIIATDVGGCGDVVSDGINGLLVKAGSIDELTEAMIKLAENIKLRQSMANASENLSRNYDIHQCVIKYEKLYSR